MFGIPGLGWLYASGFGWVINLLQIVCILHALLRRRDYYWYLVIVFVPVIGSLLYLFMNVLPDLRRVDVAELTEPLQTSDMRLRRAEMAINDANTLNNRLILAREQKRAKKYEAAIATLAPMMHGVQRDDPLLQFELAEAKYLNKQLPEAIEELLALQQNCPMELRGPTWLLLARSHEEQNNLIEAERCYAEAIKNFSGEEAKFRYTNFLISQSRIDQAKPMLDEIIKSVRRSAGVYQHEQRQWLKMAEELKKKIG